MKAILFVFSISLMLSSPDVFARCYRRAGGAVVGNLAFGAPSPLVEVKCDTVIDNLVNYGGTPHVGQSRSRSSGERVCGVFVNYVMEKIPDSKYANIVGDVEQFDPPEKTIHCLNRSSGYRAVVAIYADGHAYAYLFNK